VDGLIGVMGDKADAPEEVVGGLVGDRLVGDVTVNEERLRDNAAVFVLPGVFVADRSARPGW
jgi:hypothetical protein